MVVDLFIYPYSSIYFVLNCFSAGWCFFFFFSGEEAFFILLLFLVLGGGVKREAEAVLGFLFEKGKKLDETDERLE